jgi:bacterial polymer biosynthesis proteins, WecB/TagA/CpsF family
MTIEVLVNMENYFGINYTFDKHYVHSKLDEMVLSSQKGYICVADGVTLAMSSKKPELKDVLADSVLTICDSGWVPLYLKVIYGIKRKQYSGSDFLEYIATKENYRLMFLGSNRKTLDALKKKLSQKNEEIASMAFENLPFCDVSGFDYEGIANMIKVENPDIVLISLGMPKQELFMHNLIPFLEKGILVGVGAAFKFHSGLSKQRRAPSWVIKIKLEWLFRIFSEPRKQIERCLLIFFSMPGLFFKELKKSRKKIYEY